jgi:hypothetical protein
MIRANALSQNLLPPPDANTLYMIHFPRSVQLSGACINYCSFHTFAVWNNNGINTEVHYAAIPDPAVCPNACDISTNEFDSITYLASHELLDAITDPRLDAWFDVNGNEIADPCEWTTFPPPTFVGVDGQTYAVTPGFSNGDGGCIMTPTANTFAVTAANGFKATSVNTPANFTLSTSPPCVPLTYAIVTSPAHGTLSGTAPNLTYQPVSTYVGLDSLTYQAVAAGGAVSNDATVTFSVGPIPHLTYSATGGTRTSKTITLKVSIGNNGLGTATGVTITGAPLNGRNTLTAVGSLGNIAPGHVVTKSLAYPASVGTTGTSATLKLVGHYKQNVGGVTSTVTINVALLVVLP